MSVSICLSVCVCLSVCLYTCQWCGEQHDGTSSRTGLLRPKKNKNKNRFEGYGQKTNTTIFHYKWGGALDCRCLLLGSFYSAWAGCSVCSSWPSNCPLPRMGKFACLFIVQRLNFKLSASGGLCLPDPHQELCPWTTLAVPPRDYWRLRSGSLSSVQSWFTNVYMGLHLHTLSMSFVMWQMSRLISDYVPARLHHWSSAAPDCLPSATELFRSPLLVSGTVCLNMSLPHLLWLSSGPVSRHLFDISYPDPVWLYSACAVTLIAFGHYNRPCYLLTYYPCRLGPHHFLRSYRL